MLIVKGPEGGVEKEKQQSAGYPNRLNFIYSRQAIEYASC
jgi:hypothetical protein